jgi:hypothetical protein
MLVPLLTIEKVQIFFTRNFLKIPLKKNFLIGHNKPLSSCIRINFIANNIFCTF